MRKKNSIPEFSTQRSEVLLENFRKSLARQSKISLAKAFHEAAEAPAPRFWVSEARAANIIAMMLKGEDVTGGMMSKKREMFQEIFNRVKEIKAQNPDWPLGDIVFRVVNSPAPSSYTSHYNVMKVINPLRHKP